MNDAIVTQSVRDTQHLAAKFAMDTLQQHCVVGFSGDLGSGKTTFIQGILHTCGAEGPFTSPTFTIIKEYDVDYGNIRKIYHIDAYRVDSDAIIPLGWQDMINDMHAVVLVEWPEQIASVMPEDAKYVSSQWIDAQKRAYTLNA